MAISKIIFNGVTQMDVTQDTVIPNTLVSPETATKADGTQITGALQTKTSTDLTASGATVTVPAGVYTSQASKSISTGTATSASTITGTGATASSSGTTITLTKSVSNTPRITTAGYISSGTAGNSSISLSATDADFLPENIKKDVNIFGKTGIYEGSGGTLTLKMGVVRPDAELLQTWSGDYLANADKSITIPAYTTTSTTLYTGDNLTPTVTLSNANYRYYVLERFLTIPQYSITTKAAGRQEYTAMSIAYEITNFNGSTFKALLDGTAYTSRNVAVLPAGNAFIRCAYFSSGTAISVYTANTYGCAQTVNAPIISSGTAASPTFTAKDPNLTIRGSSTYLSSTYFNAITDIRCQYVIELYRIPKDTTDTYGMDGWGHYTQMLHNITCAQSSTHKLS